MSRVRVHLVGGDKFGWALDEDRRLTEEALSTHVNFSSLYDADVIHICNWYHALELPKTLLKNKVVLCHITGEPRRLMTQEKFHYLYHFVDYWVTHSSQAYDQCSISIGPTTLIPYTFDDKTFVHLKLGKSSKTKLKEQYGLPTNQYLISNFQRDSEGKVLNKPKLVKGPDILLQVAKQLIEIGAKNFHFVLAGPRRHWIRDAFYGASIPFTYVGEELKNDDYPANILQRTQLCELYNVSDLHLISSRSEGGPHAILEAVACKTKILSRPVGIAPDLLHENALYFAPDEAAYKILQDMQQNTLASTRDEQYQNLIKTACLPEVRAKFGDLYQKIAIEKLNKKRLATVQPVATKSQIRWERTLRRLTNFRIPNVVIWHEFKRPPWGGGNQFLIALRRYLLKKTTIVFSNRCLPIKTTHVFNSVTFNVDRFSKLTKQQKHRYVHRIDGPYFKIRGVDNGTDAMLQKLNKKYADYSIIQSFWCAKELRKANFKFKNTLIIPNAVDPGIFFPRPNTQFRTTKRLKIIGSSWSNNPRKGGAIYKWLEDNLDSQKYEFTFVGNSSERLDKATVYPAMNSKRLANLLREHHIYITASQSDPCSNALIEAQCCGLPALFLNDGGHPELVQLGGVAFNGTHDLLAKLDYLAENLQMFRSLITPPDYEKIMTAYKSILID